MLSGLGRYFGTYHGALWLLFATSVGNALAYGYQVLMARLLRPEDYAVLTVLFGILLVESIGVQVIQSATARIVARYRARGQYDALHAFVRRWMRRIAVGSGLPALLILLAAPLVARALSLPLFSSALLGIALFLVAVLTFAGGLLQGLGRFGWLGWNFIFQAATRLGVGLALVLLGQGVDGAFTGVAVALLVGLVGTAIPLASLPRTVHGSASEPSLGRAESRFFLLASLVLVAYAALTNMDAVLVRTILSAEDGGAYAGAITMAKVVLFAPIAVGLILLERTAHAHARDESTERALYVALGFVLLTSGGVALAYLARPELLTAIVLGGQYKKTATIVGLYGIAALSNALLTLWNAYFIGRGEMKIGFVLAAGVVLQLLLLLTVVRDPQTMVHVILGISLAMQAASITAFVLGLTTRRSARWARGG